MIDLARLAWPSVPERPLVLVPLGSTEQHGPHLPFVTDAIVATAVASGLATAVAPDPTATATAAGLVADDARHSSGSSSGSASGASGVVDVVVIPALPFGASGEHQDFPGTVSIGTGALRTVLVELTRSLATWAGRILFVNGHGGNIAALAAAIPQLIGEGHDVAWLPCVARDADAHAGRTETSLILALAPESVGLARAAPGNVSPMSDLLTALQAQGTRAVSPSGVLGDPTGASAEEGQLLLAEMIDGAARRLQGWTIDERGCLRDGRPA